MHKYGGQLIHCSRDEYGLIEVVEDGLARALHFGTAAKQSEMLLHDPTQLALGYTRAMSAALLLRPDPARVLLIGLGGGSLAKFLLHHLPRCEVDAVECREAVYRLARRHFRLDDDPRLTVYIDDGARFLAGRAGAGRYDLAAVDAFLDEGIAGSACSFDFLADCRRALTGRGVLAVNLWTRDSVSAAEYLQLVSDVFEGPCLELPVEGKDNVVAFCRAGGLRRRDLTGLEQPARELAAFTRVEYPHLLRRLRKANRRLF